MIILIAFHFCYFYTNKTDILIAIFQILVDQKYPSVLFCFVYFVFLAFNSIQFSSAHFFCFVSRISRVRKKWGFSAFLGLFGPFSLFSL